jgi:hypothetical protein
MTKDIIQNQMIAAGAPQQAFLVKPINVDRAVRTVQWENANRVKEVSRERQLDSLAAFVSSDLSYPCTFGISSSPNDAKAKRVAVDLMRGFIERGKRVHWTTVLGTFRNEARDRLINCDLLILGNVLYDSTPTKIECCRDILELYQGIPRIVVTSGNHALALFNDRLNFPLNGFIHIR